MTNEGQAVSGYVVEADTPGLYYHRTGTWVRYPSPAEGYVWTPEECAAIREASDRGWAHRPSRVHPAVHDEKTGITIITGTATAIDRLEASAGDVQVPTSGGRMLDLRAALSLSNGGGITGIACSL